MADSIQSFVEKLQAEGIDVGRAEAGKLVDDAKAEAAKIIAEAKAQAEGILEDARKQAEETLQQGRGELEMASRDALLRLRESLVDVLEAVLKDAAGEALGDPKFLAGLMHDICVQYAEKDAVRDWPVRVRVSDEELKAATEWALKEMRDRGRDDCHMRIDLKGKLKSVGFEYNATGGTVEVTPESVAEVLGGMLSPKLREMVDTVVGKPADTQPAEQAPQTPPQPRQQAAPPSGPDPCPEQGCHVGAEQAP